ncbi:MAG: lytic transglycosylase domain-containing protein [Clostridiales bacterium]|nr:lytic transglycosylase domain-containing protein [Clostridiales bacterium]
MKKIKLVSITAGLLALGAIVAALTVTAVFPNKYSTEIGAAANEFGLNPAFVKSVVWAESKFDKTALSNKGAQGLMQLMPATFDECATALGIKNADPFEPEHNIRCGCYYLSLMLEKFDDDKTAALAAYNAGEANAKKFLAGEAEIFAETRGYIEAVNKAEWFYSLIRN